jgi:hypothetical protein
MTNQIQSRERFLSWENLNERIELGVPFVQEVPGTPAAHFFFEPSRAELGVRIVTESSELPLVQPASIRLSIQEIDRQLHLEVRSGDELLFREFYDFCCEVVDEVQVNGTNPNSAVDAEWGAWVRLLDREAILSREKQIGLIGELWFLEKLYAKNGFSQALDSWHKENSAEHDFCLSKIDVEVKTTTNEMRIHQIGSMTQLQPSNDRSLHLLSVQLTPSAKAAKGAMSLSSFVKSMVTLAPTSELENQFLERLRATGWRDEHSRHYNQTYLLRSEPVLILVDSSCPRITSTELGQMANNPIERIKAISYRIDVSGLGQTFLDALITEEQSNGK